MKKHLFITFFILVTSTALYAEENLVSVRNLFYRATESEGAADSLYQKMKLVKQPIEPAMLGYKSMSHFMICYHTFNPYTKYKYFLSGKTLMEDAIKIHPNNIELRFLRLTIQLNVPDFLGYSNDIEMDKKMILANAKNIKDKDLFNRMYQYAITSKKLNADEKQLLQKALLQNQLAKK